jgi:hypothetical protein
MTETLILAALILLLLMCAVEFVHFRSSIRRLRRATGELEQMLKVIKAERDERKRAGR